MPGAVVWVHWQHRQIGRRLEQYTDSTGRLEDAWSSTLTVPADWKTPGAVHWQHRQIGRRLEQYTDSTGRLEDAWSSTLTAPADWKTPGAVHWQHRQIGRRLEQYTDSTGRLEDAWRLSLYSMADLSRFQASIYRSTSNVKDRLEGFQSYAECPSLPVSNSQIPGFLIEVLYEGEVVCKEKVGLNGLGIIGYVEDENYNWKASNLLTVNCINKRLWKGGLPAGLSYTASLCQNLGIFIEVLDRLPNTKHTPSIWCPQGRIWKKKGTWLCLPGLSQRGNGNMGSLKAKHLIWLQTLT